MLALSVIGISFAAPLVRLSHAHAVVIATWRLGFSLIIVGVALAITGGWRQWRTLDRTGLAARRRGRGDARASFLGVERVDRAHDRRRVGRARRTPAGDRRRRSAVWLREPPSRRQWIGIALAMIGAVVLGSADWRRARVAHAQRALLGDVLALGGGVAAAVYFVAGRRCGSSSISGRTSDSCTARAFVALLASRSRHGCRCCNNRRASSRSSRRSRSARCCSATRE